MVAWDGSGSGRKNHDPAQNEEPTRLQGGYTISQDQGSDASADPDPSRPPAGRWARQWSFPHIGKIPGPRAVSPGEPMRPIWAEDPGIVGVREKNGCAGVCSLFPAGSTPIAGSRSRPLRTAIWGSQASKFSGNRLFRDRCPRPGQHPRQMGPAGGGDPRGAGGLAIRHAHAGWMAEARGKNPRVRAGGTVDGVAVPAEYCLAAVWQNGFAVGQIGASSRAVRLEAVRQDPMAPGLIRHKTRALVAAAVLREPRAARFVGPVSLARVSNLVGGTLGNWLEYYQAALEKRLKKGVPAGVSVARGLFFGGRPDRSSAAGPGEGGPCSGYALWTLRR